ncbi:hypothetical protein ACFYQQ_22900 [Streptomyces sp. NPDC005496]|uniref:hypothetical protein n=1 Tax=Streptomyces sp. NPDC005496 TaxID=3364716 RepID=UPI003681BAA0
MTQSGQGDQPSARPAREGIVLPSDGGEPLLPGTTGDRTAPAGGQAWNRSWGPEAPAEQGPGPGAAPDGGHGQPPGHGWGAPRSGADGAVSSPPAWGASEPSPPAQDWGGSTGGSGNWQASGTGGQGWNEPHAAQGGYEPGASRGRHASASGQGWDGAPAQPQPLPPEGARPDDPYGTGAHAPGQGPGGYGAPLPPQAPDGRHAPSHRAGAASPLPPADEGATQYLPPVPPAAAHPDEGATQYLPPVPAAPDEGATQFLPPVGSGPGPAGPGALPPEMPADATRYLGRAPRGGTGPGPSAADPDAQATQYIAPVPAEPAAAPYGTPQGGSEERTPPAEFDNLFRSEAEGPASTQQLPRVDPRHPQRSGPGAPGGRAAARRGAADDGGGRRRTGSRVPLIVAVGLGIAVLGVGAGALLSTGSDGDGGTDGKPVSAAASTGSQSASPSADPAKEQAVALDKLLADSNDSRASVIAAVGNVRACDNLGQAATDLRAAAKQRNDLVTRLSGLKVDKLPNNADLTTALTNAWKASASADSHYAAWADQTAGRHGCRKHRARTTPQSQAGDRASVTASAQKTKAAQLWNSIASTYGLTQRQPTQL